MNVAFVFLDRLRYRFLARRWKATRQTRAGARLATWSKSRHLPWHGNLCHFHRGTWLSVPITILLAQSALFPNKDRLKWCLVCLYPQNKAQQLKPVSLCTAFDLLQSFPTHCVCFFISPGLGWGGGGGGCGGGGVEAPPVWWTSSAGR